MACYMKTRSIDTAIFGICTVDSKESGEAKRPKPNLGGAELFKELYRLLPSLSFEEPGEWSQEASLDLYRDILRDMAALILSN